MILDVLGGCAEAEISVATGTDAVGVLVPAENPELCGRLLAGWPSANPAMSLFGRRFVRCDLVRDRWVAVTWYRDPVEDEYADLGPVTLIADRFRPAGRCERTVYLSAAAERMPALRDVVSLVCGRAGVTDAAAGAALETMARLGWITHVGVTLTGPRPRLKINAATRELPVALAPALSARFRQLRAPLGYVACTVDGRGLSRVRLYARPIPGRQLAAVLGGLR
ncbi:hypothetical protein StrepF001_42195 [Streptomyces sp. F001]|uniref:hypothetical protein n=1 Tax=Streptomyces sp. F001 TaxID=1510026 RepID=UPI00101E6162|nr:hypothetical protein [Streptomyces sp. F001]RZB13789.1 hypothetical protein StrepF001_42195 [Streptomyces sp. F001]